MGRNLVLNMAGHGFTAAGHDKDQAQARPCDRICTHGIQKAKSRVDGRYGGDET
ncbi:MAG: hypothetical protein WBL61_22115 [Bryobacteraceae bacterium]